VWQSIPENEIFIGKMEEEVLQQRQTQHFGH